MTSAARVAIVRDPEKARALFDRQRLRILENLRDPGSATGVARKIGLPRQQVNYHLRELEKQGLVEMVEERRVRNCVERLVRATAASYLVSPEALGALGTTAGEHTDRFSAAWLVTAAARVIRDLAVLGVRSAGAGKRLVTLTLETEIRFATAESRHAFAEDLANTMARLAAKYHSPGGREFRVVVGAYPKITRQEGDGATTARLE